MISWLKWKIKSRYEKLLYRIDTCINNKMRLWIYTQKNAIVLDFTENKIEIYKQPVKIKGGKDE